MILICFFALGLALEAATKFTIGLFMVTFWGIVLGLLLMGLAGIASCRLSSGSCEVESKKYSSQGSFDLKQFSSSSLVIRGFLLDVCFISFGFSIERHLA